MALQAQVNKFKCHEKCMPRTHKRIVRKLGTAFLRQSFSVLDLTKQIELAGQ